MIYFEKIPTIQLSSCIEKFWYCKTDDLTNTTLTIPLLNHELVFNFSKNYSISEYSAHSTLIENPIAWISGIQTRPTVTKCVGKHEMVGVLFKPTGLKEFTKYHSFDFKNHFIDATLIFGKSFEDLLDQIQNTNCATTKISFIEKYLLKNRNLERLPKYLNASLDLFSLPSEKRISIKEICNQISISNKSLIKTYQKHIGVTPIKYLQLLSINKALNHIARDPKQSLAKLTYDLNFYDQAHFINSFKTITRLTPSEYANKVSNNLIDSNYPNFIGL